MRLLVSNGHLTIDTTGRRVTAAAAALIRRRAPPPVNIRQVGVVVRAHAAELVPPAPHARARRAGVDSHLGGGGVPLAVVRVLLAGHGEARGDAAAGGVRGRGRGRQLVVSTLLGSVQFSVSVSVSG